MRCVQLDDASRTKKNIPIATSATDAASIWHRRFRKCRNAAGPPLDKRFTLWDQASNSRPIALLKFAVRCGQRLHRNPDCPRPEGVIRRSRISPGDRASEVGRIGPQPLDRSYAFRFSDVIPRGESLRLKERMLRPGRSSPAGLVPAARRPSGSRCEQTACPPPWLRGVRAQVTHRARRMNHTMPGRCRPHRSRCAPIVGKQTTQCPTAKTSQIETNASRGETSNQLRPGPCAACLIMTTLG